MGIAEAFVMVGGQPDTIVLTDVDGNLPLVYNVYKGDPAIVASKLLIFFRDMSSSNPIHLYYQSS